MQRHLIKGTKKKMSMGEHSAQSPTLVRVGLSSAGRRSHRAQPCAAPAARHRKASSGEGEGPGRPPSSRAQRALRPVERTPPEASLCLSPKASTGQVE